MEGVYVHIHVVIDRGGNLPMPDVCMSTCLLSICTGRGALHVSLNAITSSRISDLLCNRLYSNCPSLEHAEYKLVSFAWLSGFYRTIEIMYMYLLGFITVTAIRLPSNKKCFIYALFTPTPAERKCQYLPTWINTPPG